MKKLFGTDGIRGIANQELTCELAIKIGKAVAEILTDSGENKPKILIGKDTRISSDMLESALFAGICSSGAEAFSLGVVPTPAVAYLTKKYSADAGIMISASHNSYEFNGIKIFDRNGYKLPDEIENKIEELIAKHNVLTSPPPIGDKIGKITKCETAISDYTKYVAETVKTFPRRLKVAIDCANGSASTTANLLFKKLNVDTAIISNSPNGTNINDNCGSTHLENLRKYVKNNNCDIGIAFDGDADRCLAVDETGETMDGDIILAICAKNLKEKGNLKNDTLVTTIMSNMGLKKFCSQNKIKFSETKVGDRYVLERMLKKGYSLGGEQSGHLIFLDYSTTGDGQLTAVQLINILANSELKASDLRNLIKKYPQKSLNINIKLSQKGMAAKNKNINDYIKNITNKLGENGRIVLRESGTEPKIRIMFEHEDENKLDELLTQAKKIVENNLK